MPTALTTGNKVMLYGDIASAYRIVDRVGLSIEMVPLVLGSNRRPTGVRGMYAFWRVGAQIVVDAAMRVTKTA
jgi:HK97 family phage major capsid protein